MTSVKKSIYSGFLHSRNLYLPCSVLSEHTTSVNESWEDLKKWKNVVHVHFNCGYRGDMIEVKPAPCIEIRSLNRYFNK